MMKTVQILLLTLPLACSSQQKADTQAGEVSVVVDRVLPRAQSLNASAIEVTLKISNPNDAALKIDRIEWEVDTGEVSGVQKGSTGSSATLEGQQAAELTF